MSKLEQKFKVGQRVKVRGWVSSALGEITDIKWIYHNRLEEYTWGYSIKYDEGQSPPITLFYVPQGYLEAI